MSFENVATALQAFASTGNGLTLNGVFSRRSESPTPNLLRVRVVLQEICRKGYTKKFLGA
jgi:hypothetical protein